MLKLSGSAGAIKDWGGYTDKIEDRFFLGGDSLRGFADGGIGPSAGSVGADTATGFLGATGGQIGGRYMWSSSAEMHFPLPVSKDLGITGFAFVDTGSLWGANSLNYKDGANTLQAPLIDAAGPRVAAGVGVSWNTPFGLINLSLADPIVKQTGDQVQQFRVSFGTRF